MRAHRRTIIPFGKNFFRQISNIWNVIFYYFVYGQVYETNFNMTSNKRVQSQLKTNINDGNKNIAL